MVAKWILQYLQSRGYSWEYSGSEYPWDICSAQTFHPQQVGSNTWTCSNFVLSNEDFEGKKCITPKGSVIKTLFDFKTMFLRSGFSQFFLWAYMYVHSSISTSKYIMSPNSAFFPSELLHVLQKKSLYFTVAFGSPLQFIYWYLVTNHKHKWGVG